MKNDRPVSEASQAFSFSRRAWLLGMGQGAVGVALAARMGWLAIAENKHFSQLSESNRVNLTLMPPRRGWIVDRHGVPIANNRTSFRVDIIPDRLEDRERVLATLGRLLALTPEQIARVGVDLDNAAGFQPVQVADKLDWERFASVNVHLPELPGVAPSQTFARHYPAGAAVAHLTGYVGAATAEQYKATHDPLLVVPGFKLGKDGLEKTLEADLRGIPGAKRNEVTARGRLIATLATRPGTPGRNRRLTIDVGLQEYTARRLGTNSGSAVVLDCDTGEILALVSMPAYDPNSFSDGISHLEWDMLSANDHVPLMNKVTQGLYPPGSTVKPMHALALLEAGVQPSDGVVCTGAIRVGNGIFHCHQKRGHGHVDMERAIAQSCDIYFFEMARRLGYDRFAPVARTMGLEQKFDLPLAAQRFGTVPDSAWKLRHYKQKWTVADSINASIGQGYVLANPAPARGHGGADRVGADGAAEPARRPRRPRARAALRSRASRDRSVGDGRGGQRRRHRRRGAAADPRRQARRQDRHRAGAPHHHGRAQPRRPQERVAAVQAARPRVVRLLRAGRQSALRGRHRPRTWRPYRARARHAGDRARPDDLSARPPARAGDARRARAGLGRRHRDADGGASDGVPRGAGAHRRRRRDQDRRRRADRFRRRRAGDRHRQRDGGGDGGRRPDRQHRRRGRHHRARRRAARSAPAGGRPR